MEDAKTFTDDHPRYKLFKKNSYEKEIGVVIKNISNSLVGIPSLYYPYLSKTIKEVFIPKMNEKSDILGETLLSEVLK